MYTVTPGNACAAPSPWSSSFWFPTSVLFMESPIPKTPISSRLKVVVSREISIGLEAETVMHETEDVAAESYETLEKPYCLHNVAETTLLAHGWMSRDYTQVWPYHGGGRHRPAAAIVRFHKL